MQKRYLIGNWKMNLTAKNAVALAHAIMPVTAKLRRTQVGLAPSFTAIATVAQRIAGSGIQLGGQNVCGEAKGAFTGEISVEMLRELGCSFAIIGHSERRHTFGESIEIVARRVHGALSQAFATILCVGETLAERDAGRTLEVLDQQLAALEGLRYGSRLTIAYEPVWAIGTGRVASPDLIASAHQHLAQRLEHLGGPAPILYGGSVNPGNLREILQVPHVDGALVGGASLSAETFSELLQITDGE